MCIKIWDDLFSKKSLFRINCKSANKILQKNVQNIIFKQIFPTILSAFDFDIEFIQRKKFFPWFFNERIPLGIIWLSKWDKIKSYIIHLFTFWFSKRKTKGQTLNDLKMFNSQRRNQTTRKSSNNYYHY